MRSKWKRRSITLYSHLTTHESQHDKETDFCTKESTSYDGRKVFFWSDWWSSLLRGSENATSRVNVLHKFMSSAVLICLDAVALLLFPISSFLYCNFDRCQQVKVNLIRRALRPRLCRDQRNVALHRWPTRMLKLMCALAWTAESWSTKSEWASQCARPRSTSISGALLHIRLNNGTQCPW